MVHQVTKILGSFFQQMSLLKRSHPHPFLPASEKRRITTAFLLLAALVFPRLGGLEQQELHKNYIREVTMTFKYQVRLHSESFADVANIFPRKAETVDLGGNYLRRKNRC